MGTKQIKVSLMAICVMSLFALLPTSAHANSITFTLSAVFGAPGSTATVYGTITNTGSSTIYLNGASFSLSSPSFLNGDTTNFFLNAPLSLAGGTNSGLIGLFSFGIAPGTPRGLYSGSFLDILGGLGPSCQ